MTFFDPSFVRDLLQLELWRRAGKRKRLRELDPASAGAETPKTPAVGSTDPVARRRWWTFGLPRFSR